MRNISAVVTFLIFCLLAAFIFTIVDNIMFPNNTPNILKAQAKTNECKIYHDKAKELAEKSAKDLPDGQTIYFDPRMAKSNSSIAYSQIYRNCKEWGE